VVTPDTNLAIAPSLDRFSRRSLGALHPELEEAAEAGIAAEVRQIVITKKFLGFIALILRAGRSVHRSAVRAADVQSLPHREILME
jgi:hypothetical protein